MSLMLSVRRSSVYECANKWGQVTVYLKSVMFSLMLTYLSSLQVNDEQLVLRINIA